MCLCASQPHKTTVDSLFRCLLNVVDVFGSFSTEIKSAIDVTVGENATLSCQSDTAVNWQRQGFSPDTESEQICYQGVILKGFENEFAMHIDRTKTTPVYNLIILNVRKDDEGEYTCIENSGLGPRSASANLTVLHGKDIVKVL